MTEKTTLNRLLKNQSFPVSRNTGDSIDTFASILAKLEQSIVVLSDLRNNRSRIYCGEFARRIGITGYSSENSIWETSLLSLFTPEEQEEKYRAELRFFHFLRQFPKPQQRHWQLWSRLRLSDGTGVLHKMCYIFDDTTDTIEYALCVYGPDLSGLSFKSAAINSVTGETVLLTSKDDFRILTRREVQVLALIDKGMSSSEISDRLALSIHTVSRHRQKIISKLQVKSTLEALNVAKSMSLI